MIEKSKCTLCNGEREILDKTIFTKNGLLKAPCPKCGGKLIWLENALPHSIRTVIVTALA